MISVKLSLLGQDPLLSKMTNLLMKHGKKAKAERILYRVFLLLDESYPGQALTIFYGAVFNLQMLIGIRGKPRGKKHRKVFTGKDTFVPHFLSDSRGQVLAIRSLFVAGRSRDNTRPLWDNLSQEFLDAASNRGDLILKLSQVHETGELNKRYYRFCWQRKFPVDPERLVAYSKGYSRSLDKQKEIGKWQKRYFTITDIKQNQN